MSVAALCIYSVVDLYIQNTIGSCKKVLKIITEILISKLCCSIWLKIPHPVLLSIIVGSCDCLWHWISMERNLMVFLLPFYVDLMAVL